MNELNLTWKDVLNSTAEFAPNWGHIRHFLPLVDRLGYRYFSWNDVIYELLRSPKGLSYKQLEITVQDLNGNNS